MDYVRLYERELQRAKNALFTARSVREIRALKNRIKFLEQMLTETRGSKRSRRKAKRKK